MSRATLRVLLSVATYFNFSIWAFPQSTTSNITGIISDASGARLPGVAVTVRNIRTNAERVATTDEYGNYTVVSLQNGEYLVRAELSGFKTAVREVSLSSSETRTVHITLSVGQVTEEVIVTAEIPVANTTTSEVGGYISQRAVTELPINARDYTRLALLIPGAAPRSQNIASVTFNGMSSTNTNWMLDGIDTSRIDFGFLANGFERGAKLLTGSVDAIAEFKVMAQNFSAEFGRSAGGVITVVSKSGGNEFHGAAFDFFRNDAFDARNYFAPPDQKKPAFRFNQFGGNISGPIVKDRTFFFGNYEGDRQRLGAVVNGTVPSLEARQLADRRLEPILAVIPMGQKPTTNPLVDSYQRSESLRVDENTISTRIDHRFSDNDSFFVRVNHNRSNVNGPLFFLMELTSRFATNQKQIVPTVVTNVAVTHTHIFNPNAVNEFKTGMQRYSADLIQPGGGLPVTTIAGVSISPGDGGASFSRNNSFQWVDNFSYTRRNHSLKFGAEIRRVQLNRQSVGTTSITFASFQDFLRNSAASATFSSATPGRGIRQTQYGLYAQDDVKLSRNFTLNLGLRWEFYTVLNEVAGRALNWNPENGSFTNRAERWYNPDYNNFAPRTGFAWDISGKDRTILRGGYGIYYNVFEPGWGPALINNTLPGNTTITRTEFPALGFPLPDPSVGRQPLPRLSIIKKDRRDLYNQQWNLNIQQRIASSTYIQLAYVGSHAVNQVGSRNINLVNPNTGRRPFADLSDISLSTSDKMMIYHSGQLSVRRQSNRGMILDFAYTWGKALQNSNDLGFEAISPQDADNRKAERGPISRDYKHRASLTAIYDLPFGPGRRFGSSLSGAMAALAGGWQINAAAQMHTGPAFTVLLGTNSRGDFNFTNQRPDYAGGPQRAARPAPQQWLNLAAFTVPAPGTFGNLGRSTVRGPGLVNVDFSIGKTFKLAEKHSLQFRAETFNLPNHPNFFIPENRINNAAFGKVQRTFGGLTGLGAQRQMQFGLKYLF